MSILAAVLFTAILMGYPLHRAAVERDKAQRQADASDELLRAIFRSTPDNVVPLRREGGR